MPKKRKTNENMGWLRPFGLKTRVLIDLDEENSNLMSVCSESLIFDRFRARNCTYVRTRTGKDYLGFPPSLRATPAFHRPVFVYVHVEFWNLTS